MAGAVVVTRAQLRACAQPDASMRYLVIEEEMKVTTVTGSPCAARPGQ
jgi:hypothetical protein